jgi:hypothetical protein
VLGCLFAWLAFAFLIAGCGSGSGAQSSLPTRAVVSGIAHDGTTAGGALAAGSWGGDHIRLTVTVSGAALEFDCAHASITEPTVLDGTGAFDLPGLYTAEHGGPIHEGDVLPSKPVRYTGNVTGGTMELRITFAAGGATQGSYTLTRGEAAHLLKCL